jgi:acyl-CoA reductase-like NAD-dependent aldehyde dehydrogenase
MANDITRGIQFAHKLQAGTAWINCTNSVHPNVPFGGYKQSGIGREMGEYALNKYVSSFPCASVLREFDILWTVFSLSYTNVKAVQINLGVPI